MTDSSGDRYLHAHTSLLSGGAEAVELIFPERHGNPFHPVRHRAFAEVAPLPCVRPFKRLRTVPQAIAGSAKIQTLAPATNRVLAGSSRFRKVIRRDTPTDVADRSLPPSRRRPLFRRGCMTVGNKFWKSGHGDDRVASADDRGVDVIL